jgi:hypothetical protein
MKIVIYIMLNKIFEVRRKIETYKPPYESNDSI